MHVMSRVTTTLPRQYTSSLRILEEYGFGYHDNAMTSKSEKYAHASFGRQYGAVKGFCQNDNRTQAKMKAVPTYSG